MPTNTKIPPANGALTRTNGALKRVNGALSRLNGAMTNTNGALSRANGALTRFIGRFGGSGGGALVTAIVLTMLAASPAVAQFSDACASGGSLGVGSNVSVVFSTLGATTDGPAHAACLSSGSGDNQIYNDVWATYTATAGDFILMVDLCDSTFDSRLAIYAGASCPTASTVPLACIDDSCFENPTRPNFNFRGTAGQTYRIRIGSKYNNAVPGEGVGTGTCRIIVTPQLTPSIWTVEPSVLIGSNTPQAVTVVGNRFVLGLQMWFQRPDNSFYTILPTSLNPTRIVASHTFGTDPQDWTIEVINPGGAHSNEWGPLSVLAPFPVITSLSPFGTSAGGPAFMLTVNGSTFHNGSVVRWNGVDRVTTRILTPGTPFVVGLRAAISAADIATAGTATVTVFSPGPGGGHSVGVGFPITVTCDSIDFNSDTSVFDPIDIDALLSVYGEGPCIPAGATCNDIDFNNDTSVFDPCDISSFLVVYSEGPCTACGT